MAPDRQRLEVNGFAESASRLGVTVTRDEPMARHTTFRIGGPADAYAAAKTIDQLEALSDLAWEHELPLTVLGGGSNVLVSDAGIRGVVVANQTRGQGLGPDYAPDWLPEPLPEGCLASESGVAAAGLARWAIRNGYAGLEWAVSVPGTIGGAVIGNAGAHGGDIASKMRWALATYPRQGRRLWWRDELAYAYRSSLLRAEVNAPVGTNYAKPVVLAAAFDLEPGDTAELTAKADEFLRKRRASQPTEPSIGSIFRNPPGAFAGQLVESAGLKGQQIGGAQISLRHANFIVNTGNASAADVTAMIELIRHRVYEMHGVRLMPEILFLGEWEREFLSAL